jgi:hypothetical protein
MEPHDRPKRDLGQIFVQKHACSIFDTPALFRQKESDSGFDADEKIKMYVRVVFLTWPVTCRTMAGDDQLIPLRVFSFASVLVPFRRRRAWSFGELQTRRGA